MNFTALDALSVMTQAAAIMRGYGVRIVWIVQNITQLIEMYHSNCRDLFRQCGAGADFQHQRQGRR